MSLGSLPEQRFRVVYNALIGLVIGIGEEDVPVRWQSLGVDSEAMVLTGDEATACSFMEAWLVVATVTISENDQKCYLLGLFRFED